MLASRGPLRLIAVIGLATVLVLVAASSAGSKAKTGKPIKAGASVTISSRLVSSDSQYAFFDFSGKVSSRSVCRADRQVAVAVSMDGGPAVPDNRKGGFTARDGSWVSVYDVLLNKGHTYTAVARLNRTNAKQGQKRYSCKAAASQPLTLAP